MEATKIQCPKCGSQMDTGFVLDRSLLLIGEHFPRWLEGEPERGISGGWKVVGKKTNEINRADRCRNCGYLEFYTSMEVQYV